MLDQLHSRLISANFTAVHFVIFSPGGDAALLKELRAAAPGVPVRPAPRPHTPWGRLLEGQRNNILVIDTSCEGGRGRLAYQVIMPWSMLHYPYVKAAVLSAYNDNPCGQCAGAGDAEPIHYARSHINATHAPPPSSSTGRHRVKLTDIVNRYKPSTPPEHDVTPDVTSEAGGRHRTQDNDRHRHHQTNERPEARDSDEATQGTKGSGTCNGLAEDSDGCYDPTLRLTPLRELPDGTLPIRVIMRSADGRMEGDRRYEYLELQLGNPFYHGHLDERGRRIEDDELLQGHLDDRGGDAEMGVKVQRHGNLDDDDGGRLGGGGRTGLDEKHGHLDEGGKHAAGLGVNQEAVEVHGNGKGDKDSGAMGGRTGGNGSRVDEAKGFVVIVAGSMQSIYNRSKEGEYLYRLRGESSTKDATAKLGGKKHPYVTKPNKPSDKTKTLIDLDAMLSPTDRRTQDKLSTVSSSSSSVDDAYDHHVDEFNDAPPATFEDSASAGVGKTMPWHEGSKVAIGDYVPVDPAVKQLAETYRELVPGYDGKTLEADERHAGRKKVLAVSLEDGEEDDESGGDSEENHSKLISGSHNRHHHGDKSRYSTPTVSEVSTSLGDDADDAPSGGGGGGTRETVEKTRKMIKPVRYDDSSSDSSSQGEVVTREMARESSTETKTAHRDNGKSDGKSIDDDEVQHGSTDKGTSEGRGDGSADATDAASNEKVTEAKQRKNHRGGSKKKKLDSDAIVDDDAPRDIVVASTTTDHTRPMDEASAGPKIHSTASLSSHKSFADASGEMDAGSEQQRLLPGEGDVAHESLKKKAIQREMSQEEVMSHYSQLLPWLHYEI